MIKYSCDKCGEVCAPEASGARQFERLLGTDIGLQVLPLFTGTAQGTRHLCDECMPFFMDAAATSRGASRFTRTRASQTESATELEVSLAKAIEERDSLRARLKTAEGALADAQAMAAERQRRDTETIARLQAAVTDASTELTRLGVHGTAKGAVRDRVVKQ